MPDTDTDANTDVTTDNVEESSPSSQNPFETYVRENAKTQTQDSADEEEAEEESSDEAVEGEETSEEPEPAKEPPFHEHPRFKELHADNKQLKAELAALKKEREEAAKVKTMTKEEKIAYDFKQKYGFASKEDVETVKRQNALLKEKLAFEKFLAKYPTASPQAEAIQSLAFTPKYKSKSYEEIYKEVFKGSTPERKVVKRTVRTGMKGTSSPSKDVSGSKFTREKIREMDLATYRKYEKEIAKQMKEGTIT